MSKKTKIIIACVLVAFGVASRLVPHPWNVAPIAAIALFSGVYLGGIFSVTVPMLAMLISDSMLGFASWQVTWSVYLSFFLIGLIGRTVKKHKSFEVVLASSLVGSFLFFAVTNWAVWQFADWYPHTINGLIACYIAALPFFRNTLAGDLFYTGALFGSYELFWAIVTKKYLILGKI